MDLSLDFRAAGHGMTLSLDTAALEDAWARLRARVGAIRAADEGGPRAGVLRARRGCVCGAGPERVLHDGAERTCTACGDVRAA